MPSGARILVDSLKREGVKVIFGIPGLSNMQIYDAFVEDIQNGELRHVLMRHEQAAAHAADGYARASGVPGVCTATSGPGATNLVTGLITAYWDSSPVIAIPDKCLDPQLEKWHSKKLMQWVYLSTLQNTWWK
jgi:acetolactate synthase, large subunit (EC 2.2.1.6)